MLYLLLGPDDFSKKIFIRALVLDQGADLRVFNQDDELATVSRLTENDLFSRPKVFVFDGLMPEIKDKLDDLVASKNSIIVSVESLDKRKKENQELLANKKITVKEFHLPHGQELNKWLERRVKESGGLMSKLAVDELAVRLGRDQTREIKAGGKVVSSREIYSLWQAESEIQKLMDYAPGRQIEIEDVKALSAENLEVDVFEIINAIGEGRQALALDLIREFLKADSASDEKFAVIQLNALLSDQMRSLAIIQDFIKNKVSDVEIIKRTAWKSGRLYIMKKIAARLQPQKILASLPKLEALDEELKTSQTPPRVLLDLIVAQIF